MIVLFSTLRGLSVASAFAALAGCGYLLCALFAVRRWPKRRPVGPQHSPAVSVLKPLHGYEPGLERRLLSFADQHYDGAVQSVSMEAIARSRT